MRRVTSCPKAPQIAARRFGGLVMGSVLCLAPEVNAQSLESRRSDAYYAIHGSITLGGFVASGVLATSAAPSRGGAELFPRFAPDLAVRDQFSPAAAAFSDQLLLSNVTIPLAAQLSSGFNRSFGNAALVYSEAHAINTLLTTATKVLVRRPRPYTHATDPIAREFAREQRSEAFVSFFSGHASVTHTSAMAGSILYALRTDDLWARHAMFGLEFMLAGFTSQLRVRAGRHYRTDVWVGMLVGAGVGLTVPALHGLPLSRVRGTEWATGAGATLLATLLTEAVDLRAAFDWLEPDKPSPTEPVAPESGARAASWFVVPQAWPAGAVVSGEF